MDDSLNFTDYKQFNNIQSDSKHFFEVPDNRDDTVFEDEEEQIDPDDIIIIDPQNPSPQLRELNRTNYIKIVPESTAAGRFINQIV